MNAWLNSVLVLPAWFILAQTAAPRPGTSNAVVPGAVTPSNRPPVVVTNHFILPKLALTPSTNLSKPSRDWIAQLQLSDLTPQRLAPGVYQTAPFSMLVVVPGPQADDRALHGTGSDRVPYMPTVKPDLQFIPWSPK